MTIDRQIDKTLHMVLFLLRTRSIFALMILSFISFIRRLSRFFVVHSIYVVEIFADISVHPLYVHPPHPLIHTRTPQDPPPPPPHTHITRLNTPQGIEGSNFATITTLT